MTIWLGMNCSFVLLGVSFVNLYNFLCVLLSLLIWRVDVGFDCINS